MKKILKTLLLGSLIFGSLIGCEKEETNIGTNNENNTTENNKVDPKVTGITLNTDSVKKAYTYGDALDLTGLLVTANYDNSTTKTVTNYTTNPSNGSKLDNVGNVTVTVTYEGKSSSFNVSVEKALKDITLDTSNVKKDYVFKDKLDLTGLVVKAVYNDDSTLEVSGYTVNPTNETILTEGGDNTVTVTYNGISKSFKVSVDKAVKSIELDTTNVKKEYNYGDKFTSSGLVVKGVYANGVKEVIDSGLYFGIQEETELFEPGEKVVTVSFGSLSSSYKINVVKDPSSITVNANAVKQNYKIGEKLDLTGLVVTATYPSGATEEVTDYTTNVANNSDLNTAGKFDLVVTYLNKTDSFEITVVKTVVGVTFNASKAKLYYHYGAQLDLTGLVVTVTYDDGSSEITTNYSQSIANGTALKTTEGTEDIIIAYGQFTYTVTIEVDVGSCWLNTAQMKTVYNYGEVLNTDGLRAFVKFEDGETEDLVIKRTEPENGTIVDTIDQYFYVVVVYVTNTGKDQGQMLALPVRFADETGTHGNVDLSSALTFSGDSAPIKAVGTRGSNFKPVFYFKPTTLMESAFESNMQRTIFKKDYELYNYDSIGGITSIRVNGGEDNYDLYVGYTKENMYKFLESTADGDSRIYSNIPNVNYMKIVGKSNEQPAYISSVEFDYTRDANHQMVEGRTSFNPLSTTGSFAAGGKNLTLNQTSLIIETSTFTYTGIIYKDCPLYVEEGGNTILSVNDRGTKCIIITDLTNSTNSEYSNTYYEVAPVPDISMYINNVEVSENVPGERIVFDKGESINFSAVCNTAPDETVSITLVDETHPNPDCYCGKYSLSDHIIVSDPARMEPDCEITVKSIEIEKIDGKYYAAYEDEGTNNYPGHNDIYLCTMYDNYFEFGDDFTLKIYNNGLIDFQYGNMRVLKAVITYCSFIPNSFPTAVYNEGQLSTMSPGNFYLECKTSNDLVTRLYCNVKGYIPAKIMLYNLGIDLNVGQSTTLSYEIASGASNPLVTFESSNTNVATVSDTGVITGVSNGTATITISTADDTQTINVYVGTAQSVNSLKYKFTDDGNNEHVLTLLNEVSMVIDGTYIFEYSEGLYVAASNGKYTILELTFNGLGLFLNFVDENGIFSSSGPIVTNTSSAYKLTLIDDTTSSASTGQSEGVTVIGTGGEQSHKIYYFTFCDSQGNRHQIVCREGLDIVLDGVFIFNYFKGLYIYTGMIGGKDIDCALRINLEFGLLNYNDFGRNFFSNNGVVKANDYFGLITLQRV